MKTLYGKTVLITGGATGIGHATALSFAKHGANIVVNYLTSKKEADVLVNKIRSVGIAALAVRCDVSNETQVKKMVDTINKVFGGVDILVNNAGIVKYGSLLKKTAKEWKRTIDVNLIGAFLCSKYVAGYMKKKGGSIVNVSSTNALNTFNPDVADYNASKAGMISLTKDLAKELPSRVRINALAVGWVKTNMTKDMHHDRKKKECRRIPSRRFADAKEIADVVIFLASEKSSYVSGSIITVDGGYH